MQILTCFMYVFIGVPVFMIFIATMIMGVIVIKELWKELTE